MLGGPHTQPFTPRSTPQNVLSYYVHGMPFVHGEHGTPESEYTLAGARSAAANRIQAGTQRHPAQPSSYYLPEPNTYIPNSQPESLYMPSHQPPHSFYPGYYHGTQMTQQLGNPSFNHTLVNPPYPMHRQMQTSPSRTPPTPALSDGARSAATSPDHMDEHYFQQRLEPAWAVHEALTKVDTAMYPRGHGYQEPVHYQSRPGVGPRGHVLGGSNKTTYVPEQTYAAPAEDRFTLLPPMSDYKMTHVSYANAVQPAQPMMPSAHVGPTGHVLGQNAAAAAERRRGVGPSGHVLGGSPARKNSAQSEVLYTSTPATPPGLPPPSRIPTLQRGGLTSPSKTITPPRVVGTADPNSPSPSKVKTRPRALSRMSSMNLQNALDTVVEEDEAAAAHTQEDEALSETTSEDFLHDNLALRTPRDECFNTGVSIVGSSRDGSPYSQERKTPVIRVSQPTVTQKVLPHRAIQRPSRS